MRCIKASYNAKGAIAATCKRIIAISAMANIRQSQIINYPGLTFGNCTNIHSMNSEQFI